EHLARRDHREQSPELVAVTQIRVLALGGAPADAVDGAQGGVLLVLDHPRPGESPTPSAGQPHQRLEVALPELARVVRVARLQVTDPARDGAARCRSNEKTPPSRAPRPTAVAERDAAAMFGRHETYRPLRSVSRPVTEDIPDRPRGGRAPEPARFLRRSVAAL